MRCCRERAYRVNNKQGNASGTEQAVGIWIKGSQVSLLLVHLRPRFFELPEDEDEVLGLVIPRAEWG